MSFLDSTAPTAKEALFLIERKNRHKGSLRDFDIADHLHALFALFLLLQQLSFSSDIAAVALAQHILAERADSLAGNNLATDCSLNRHLEHLAWDQPAQLFNQRTALRIGEVAMDDQRECVHWCAVNQNIELDQIGLLVSGQRIVKRGIPLCA